MTKLYEVDPSLVEGRPLPVAFADSVYAPADLMRLLEITDESEFWLAYRGGLFPLGVWLPTNLPIVVWDRELIDKWMAAGCPVAESHERHCAVVLTRLLRSVEDTLPARPLARNELN